MNHYRALKWGAFAVALSPVVLLAASFIYFGLGSNVFVIMAMVLLVEAYTAFIFYCVLCIPAMRRILLLASATLILGTGALFFAGPRAAVMVLVSGFIGCILGGLPKWVAIGVAIFIANTFVFLTSNLLMGVSTGLWGGHYEYHVELQLAYVALAYCGLGVALVPNLDWGAYLSRRYRSEGKVPS